LPVWRLKKDMKVWSAIRVIQRPYLRSLDKLAIKQRAVAPKMRRFLGDIFVIAILFSSYLEMPVEELKRHAVIDVNNYFPARDGNYPEIDSGRVTSAELLARHLYVETTKSRKELRTQKVFPTDALCAEKFSRSTSPLRTGN
jgi:hypothetical protein